MVAGLEKIADCGICGIIIVLRLGGMAAMARNKGR
jgi:hypothetical protein